MYRYPHQCPICVGKTTISEVSCHECGTHITGQFDGCRFCGLSAEESAFLLTFIRCRGSIKDVERELGVSYPTVRAMLDNLILALDREEGSKPTVLPQPTPVSVIDTRMAACTSSPTSAKPRKKQDNAETRRLILERVATHEITAEEAAELLKKL